MRWTRGLTFSLPGKRSRLRDSGFHFLTAEYPPARGGVADYTRLVARELAAREGTVHVWAPQVSGPEVEDARVIVHRVPAFDPSSLEKISKELEALPAPRRLFLQYVPTAFGFRGMNVPLVQWLRARPEDLWIQFHEVALGWKLWRRPDLNVVHVVELWMAAALARRAQRIFVSIEAWKRKLGEHARRAVWLPIPSNVPVRVEPADLERARASLGPGPWIAHFGTYSPLIRADLGPAVRAISQRRADVRFLLLGRGAPEFSRMLALGERVEAREDLPAPEIAALLKASALALQPFPDGMSGRRTSAMAPLALGVPVVTTEGFLTDPVWREGGVALAPAGHPGELAALCVALVDDAQESRSLGERGARLYRDRFSLERTLETVLSSSDAKLAQVQ
jgi:glycosyltransferase involved in cell wall biosynthesis